MMNYFEFCMNNLVRKFCKYINCRKKVMSIKEQARMALKLSFLVGAGMTVPEGVRVIKKSYPAATQDILSDIELQAQSGISFSDIVVEKKCHPTLCHFVKIGEMTGMLAANLLRAHEEISRRNNLSKKIRSALVYPAFVIFSTLTVTIGVLVYVFPKIIPVVTSFGNELPVSTKFVLWCFNFLQSYGLLFLLTACAAIAYAAMQYRARSRFCLWCDRIVLKIPYVGALIKSYSVAATLGTLSALLKVELPIAVCIRITSSSVSNFEYQRVLRDISHHIERGETFERAIARYENTFPDFIAETVSVGEKTGRLSESLAMTAEFYEREVDDMSKKFTSVVEPLSILFAGMIVGLVAISIMGPVYSITSHVGGR